VKIVHHPEDQQRLAYVNFQRSGMARKARKYCLNLLSEQLGKHLKMDPAGEFSSPHFTLITILSLLDLLEWPHFRT
jgi:hypothetical protein